MVNKLALSILVSIILTGIIISILNVGSSLFLNEPEYTDFCDYTGKTIPILESSDNITQDICEAYNGTWMPQNIQCIKAPCPQGYCDFYQKCQTAYEQKMKGYNQRRFYLFAGVGFLLLIIGLFAIENLIQFTGLGAGGILVLEGIIMNLQNKKIVFFSLLLIFTIFSVLAWKVIQGKKEDKSSKKKIVKGKIKRK
jgi:hypothetical protein